MQKLLTTAALFAALVIAASDAGAKSANPPAGTVAPATLNGE